MHALVRLALILFPCLLMLPAGTVSAQALQWVDRDHVVVCAAQAGDTAPPDFADATCRRMPLWDVDSQHATLWLRASVTLPPTMRHQSTPLGLFVSGKAASTAWLNGRPLGGNGQPGIDARSEQPGRMDAVIPLPRAWLKAGANEIVLHLSGHASVIQLDTPMHVLAIGTYADPADQILRAYWPSLVTFGIFLPGMLYFGVSAWRRRDRAGSLVLCLISLFAAGQLLAEVSRGLFPYRYPLHDVRLIAIAVCAFAFGMCLTAHVIRRFPTPRPLPVFAAVTLATVGAVVLVDGYDGKAIVAMLMPVALCALFAAYWAWRRTPGAVAYCMAFVSFGALTCVFGGAFLNAVFFYLVAALLLFLFAQQASVLADEQRQRIALAGRAQQLQAALDQAQARAQPAAQAKTIRIIDAGRVELVATDRITRCSGAGDYVELHLTDGGKRLHNGSLNEMETRLPPAFLRVHRSHIVNTACVASLQRDPSGVGRLRMTTGDVVPVSRRVMPMVRRTIGVT